MAKRYRETRQQRQQALEALYAVARDWLNTLDADGAECTCEEGDPCPRCRCVDARCLAEPFVGAKGVRHG